MIFIDSLNDLKNCKIGWQLRIILITVCKKKHMVNMKCIPAQFTCSKQIVVQQKTATLKIYLLARLIDHHQRSHLLHSLAYYWQQLLYRISFLPAAHLSSLHYSGLVLAQIRYKYLLMAIADSVAY